MFDQARVVCRFYNHPLIRDLYPEALSGTGARFSGRKQTDAEARKYFFSRDGEGSYLGQRLSERLSCGVFVRSTAGQLLEEQMTPLHAKAG